MTREPKKRIYHVLEEQDADLVGKTEPTIPVYLDRHRVRLAIRATARRRTDRRTIDLVECHILDLDSLKFEESYTEWQEEP